MRFGLSGIYFHSFAVFVYRIVYPTFFQVDIAEVDMGLTQGWIYLERCFKRDLSRFDIADIAVGIAEVIEQTA